MRADVLKMVEGKPDLMAWSGEIGSGTKPYWATPARILKVINDIPTSPAAVRISYPIRKSDAEEMCESVCRDSEASYLNTPEDQIEWKEECVSCRDIRLTWPEFEERVLYAKRLRQEHKERIAEANRLREERKAARENEAYVERMGRLNETLKKMGIPPFTTKDGKLWTWEAAAQEAVISALQRAPEAEVEIATLKAKAKAARVTTTKTLRRVFSGVAASLSLLGHPRAAERAVRISSNGGSESDLLALMAGVAKELEKTVEIQGRILALHNMTTLPMNPPDGTLRFPETPEAASYETPDPDVIN